MIPSASVATSMASPWTSYFLPFMLLITCSAQISSPTGEINYSSTLSEITSNTDTASFTPSSVIVTPSSTLVTTSSVSTPTESTAIPTNPPFIPIGSIPRNYTQETLDKLWDLVRNILSLHVYLLNTICRLVQSMNHHLLLQLKPLSL